MNVYSELLRTKYVVRIPIAYMRKLKMHDCIAANINRLMVFKSVTIIFHAECDYNTFKQSAIAASTLSLRSYACI